MQGTFGPGVLMLRCVKHVARNLRNNMTKAKNLRGFAANERSALQKAYGHLGINWVTAMILLESRVHRCNTLATKM